VVLANILAAPLRDLREVITVYCKTGGKLVMSGILDNQAEQFDALYAEDFEMEPIEIDGENLVFDNDENDNTEYNLPLTLAAGNSAFRVKLSNIGSTGIAEFELFFYGTNISGTRGTAAQINVVE
jgi:hypothetical protein